MDTIPPGIANYILISLTSFLLGLGIGWLLAERMDNLEKKEVQKLVALILIFSYVISVFAEIAVEGYHTPVLLHAIIGGVTGYLFGVDTDMITEGILGDRK